MSRRKRKKKRKASHKKTTVQAQVVATSTFAQSSKVETVRQNTSVKNTFKVDYIQLDKQKVVVMQDLRKTLILSTLAIGTLVVISLVSII